MNRKKQYLLLFSACIAVSALVFGSLLALSRSGNMAKFFSQKSEHPQIAVRKDEETNIAETVFCFQLKQHDEALKGKVIFLFTGENKDPSDDLLKRVQCGGFAIRKVSQSNMDSYPVKEKSTGKIGVILGITTIKWLKETEVEAAGVIRFDRENSQTYSFHLVKEENGKWVIRESKLIGET